MEQQQHIIDTLKTLLTHLDVVINDVTVEADERTKSLRFLISTPDSSILIGEHGARLLALNHLMKRMVERNMKDEPTSFFVDVNDYQKKRIDEIRAKANMLAERARYFKSSVEMDPMSSYERMIVHAEFTETPDISTDSTGFGKERRVIIRYTENKTPLIVHAEFTETPDISTDSTGFGKERRVIIRYTENKTPPNSPL